MHSICIAFLFCGFTHLGGNLSVAGMTGVSSALSLDQEAAAAEADEVLLEEEEEEEELLLREELPPMPASISPDSWPPSSITTFP